MVMSKIKNVRLSHLAAFAVLNFNLGVSAVPLPFGGSNCGCIGDYRFSLQQPRNTEVRGFLQQSNPQLSCLPGAHQPPLEEEIEYRSPGEDLNIMPPLYHRPPALRTDYLPLSTDEPQALPSYSANCISDDDDYMSATAMCVMKIIIAISFLAFVIECGSVVFGWMKEISQFLSPDRHCCHSSTLYLAGPEKQLEVHSGNGRPLLTPLPAMMPPDRMFSPGLEKKVQAYARLDEEKKRAEEARRGEELDYDDEMNFPVL